MLKRLLIMVLLLVSLFIFAENLDETIEQLSGAAAESYVEPIASAFGASLNGGWFHKAPKAKFFNIDVELGFVFMGSQFASDDDAFNVEGSFRFTQDQAETIASDYQGQPGYDELVQALISQDFTIGIHGATIIGAEDDHVMLEFPAQTLTVDVQGNQTDFPLQPISIDSGVGGILTDIPMIPLFAPQLGIGTIYGTKLYFRYMPPLDLGELGKFKYFGMGFQHNPKAYLKVPIPIDFCVSLFMQKMNLGDYITASAASYGLNASKTFGFRFLSFTPYVGAMLESSKMEFAYSYVIDDQDVTIDPIDIKFNVEGQNKARFVLGGNLQLGIFSLNADYNFAKYKSFTAGFGLSF